MYKFERYRQLGLADFNQPVGLKMNPENRWVKKASMIPWKEIECKYAELFPSKTGMPAKPLRMALGSLLIQKQLGFSDRELVEEIAENPYFQFFVGLPGYQTEAPFVPSLLVEFRKRLTDDILGEINEMIIDYNTPDDPTPGGSLGDDKPTPRMYRKNARRDYLNLAKSKKRTVKRICKAIKQQLQYIHRDRGYINNLLSNGCELTDHQIKRLNVIDQVYRQQTYMYQNKVHSVKDRIVSISQPYIRPIVRGKASAPVEFGA